ncbi:MAG: hypothetical protein HY924_14515 [Elusimicrobia bacterium]|nr:hypothetical protein [Elusimicrobiota bacterium]
MTPAAGGARRRLSAWDLAGAAALLALYLLSCNAVPFGQYVDDMNWLLFSEGALKGSLLRPWHHPPQLEVSLNWGVPALLMPFLAAFERPVLMLKLFMAALFFSGLAFFYLSTRSRFEGSQLPAYAAVLFLCDFLLTFSGNIMAEPGYVFILGLTVFLLFERSWLESDRPWRWALLGGLAGFIVLLRSIGLVLPLAILAELALRRKLKEGLWFGLCAGLVVLPFTLYLATHIGQASFYAPYWSLRSQGGAAAALSGLLDNSRLYLKGLTCLTAVYLPTLAAPTGLLAKAFMAAGAVLFAAGTWRNRGSSLHRFLALYAMGHFVVCAAYVYQAPRYVVPMLPAFVFLCLEGLRALVPERFFGRALAAAALLAVATNAPLLARTVRTSLAQPLTVAHASYDWLKAHASPEDRIVSMDMIRIHYFTGLKGRLFIPSNGPEEFAERFRAEGFRWLVIRDAGFIPAAKGVSDPTRWFYDRLVGYAGAGGAFDLAHRDEAEGVLIYGLK